MVKPSAVFFSIALLCLPVLARAQTDSGVLGAGSQSAIQQQYRDCQDSGSATCAPQGISQNGTDQSGENPYGEAAGSSGAIQNIPQLGNYAQGLSGQGAGLTGYQSLTQPSYRDENALPSQRSLRRYAQAPATPSPLTEFQKFVAETTGQVLPIFGERLFRNVPTTFAPVDQIPVPANAVVGPGDLLRIRIWGQVNFSDNVRVDRSGEVYLPQVGPVHVAGLPYADLDAHLRTAIARVYRNFQVSAQLGQIRSIQIYVVGRARRPGTYTVSSLSTLIDALFASGGPSEDGSLRHILLKREGRTVTDLDLYKFLVDGDKTGDVTLQPGDVLFIPPVGPQVAVLGSVKSPAIYEERTPHDTVNDLLADAAGVTAVAGDSGWSIERTVNRRARTVEHIAMNQAGLATAVGDGDILRVQPAVPRYENVVTLRGNTANPGRYAWHAGMRLSDLFPDRNALLTRNYWWQWAQLGLPSPEFERVPSLEGMVQPENPTALALTQEERAQQRQQSLEYLRREREARIASGTEKPPAATSGEAADQTSDGGDQQATEGGSLDSSGGGAGLGGLATQNRSRQQTGFASSGGPGAAISAQQNVQTENTLNSDNRTGISLPAPEIDWSYAVVQRLDPDTLKNVLLPFDLGKLVVDHDSSQNLLLQPGDVVTIFSQADIHVPVEQQTRLVRLEGEFAHAGVYSAKPGETLQQLVERAGGLSQGAYLFGSELTRVSVQAVQQRRLNQYVQQLQLQIDRGVLATSASAASSAADLASANAAGAEAQELITRLKQVRATGRIVLNLHAFSVGADSLPPLQLEDGDVFYVPPVPSSVSVIGAVYNQSSFVYVKGDHFHDYVRLAGGANREADRKHPFVIRADGSVVSRDEVGEKKFEKVVIQPGDTVVVSEKTFGPTKLRAFLDFSQLFSQLAVGAALLNNL